jgi:hypothetical protein
MATESTEILQAAFDKAKEYWKEFPEAPFSDSFKWTDVHGFEHLTTVRGWTFPAMMTSLERAASAIFDLQGKPAGVRTPAAQPQEPSRQPIDDSGHELPDVKTFAAEKLSVSMNDGKFYYKVVGKPFTQFGVPVYEEVLEAAKLDVSNPMQLPNIAGWKADYIETVKDGKKRMKVTRLLPSPSPY